MHSFLLLAVFYSFLSPFCLLSVSQLDELVAASDTKKWEETLAIAATYSKAEEFPMLCVALGDRLDAAGDSRNASLCYMCSFSLDRTVKYWKTQLDAANKVRTRQRERERRGKKKKTRRNGMGDASVVIFGERASNSVYAWHLNPSSVFFIPPIFAR